MPALMNARWERFSQEIAGGRSASEAYEAAGFKKNDGNARRLRLREAVSNRIKAILSEREHIHSRAVERAIERTAITVETLTEDLARIARAAENLASAPGLNAARAAKMDIAKLNGLIVDRSEIGKPGDFARMTEAELDRFIAERAGRAGLGASGAGASGQPPEAGESDRRLN